MTVKQAADRLEISSSLIYKLINEGKLQCVRHGFGRGTIRITDEQLSEYMELATGMACAEKVPLKWIK